MIRRGDDAFKAVVNETLRGIFQSEEITMLYKKWFMSPMPPTGRNLNLPMSQALQAVFRKPTEYAE
jgi:glutamate/aspartate transport system substrate-binding protein